MNNSFPIPPFWQSQHHLPLPTKGIGSARPGQGRDPWLTSSRFSVPTQPPQPRAGSAQALLQISSVQGQHRSLTGPCALHRHSYSWPGQQAESSAGRAAHGTLPSSVTCIKAIKINRIIEICHCFPSAQRESQTIANRGGSTWFILPW